MIVLDASAVVELLLQTAEGLEVSRRIRSQDELLHAPHIVDLEVAQTLRRCVQEENVTVERAADAVTDLQALRLVRHPHHGLLPRIWQLRHNLTAYDAAYVALAERMDATLLTRDRWLTTAPGHHARVEVI